MSRYPHTEDRSAECELVTRAAAGDVRAFEQLVQQLFGTVYSVALSRVRSREAAEELTQEVFLRAWFGLGSLKDPKLFAGWILRITRNLAIDWQRAQRRTSSLVQMLPLNDEALHLPDIRTPDVRERLAHSDVEQAIQDALFALPPDQREVVLMYYAEELSKSDIARRLRVHPSSVGRRLGTALYSMRVQLDSSVRLAVQPLRFSKPAVQRAAALAAVLAAVPQASRAAVMAKAAATAPACSPEHIIYSSNGSSPPRCESAHSLKE